MRNFLMQYAICRVVFSLLAAFLAAGAVHAQSGSVIGQPQNAPAMLISRTVEASSDGAAEWERRKSLKRQALSAGTDGANGAPARRERRAGGQQRCRGDSQAREQGARGRSTRQTATQCSRETANGVDSAGG